MTLTAGTRLGPYEIVGLIGVGGMGEVFCAKDTKLGRDVAIKVLPEALGSDADRLKRFQHEARVLASLSHPNVVQVFEAGEHKGSPYLVMELLEGETLREKLFGRPLAPKRAVEIAREVALGLSAVHSKGILHRDLKPENIFLTRDGRVKVLDFGLAKTHVTVPGSPVDSEAVTASVSESGHLAGTLGFMSPEQVQGEQLDARSDLFSLGIILWEMLTGKRPFTGGSSVEVMHAILKDELPDLDEALKVPPALERILRTCLAKEPAGRFHSAHDLAFALDALSFSGSSSTGLPRIRVFRWAVPALVGAAALLLALLALGAGAWSKHWPPFRPPSQPTFRRITFREGSIQSARFMPDGREILLSAKWGDRKISDIYDLKLSPLTLRSTGLRDAQVQAVLPSGEVAMTFAQTNTSPVPTQAWLTPGTLGTSQLGALSPRVLMLPPVASADLTTRGLVAASRWVTGRYRLECPPGTVRLENGSWFSDLRFSPDGRHLAFLEHPMTRDEDYGHVGLLDLGTGQIQNLTRDFGAVEGLAWRGKEIWFSATEQGAQLSLWAVSISGRERSVLRGAGSLSLMDLAPDGRALLTRKDWNTGLFILKEGYGSPQELTIGEGPRLIALSADGSKFLFQDETEASNGQVDIYMQPIPEGPAMYMGRGYGTADFSPDGAWVVMFPGEAASPILISTVSGEVRRLPACGIKLSGLCHWTPDGKALVIQGVKGDQNDRTYLQDIESGNLRPLGPEGTTNVLFTPDGRTLLARIQEKWVLLDPLKPEGSGVPVLGLSPLDAPLRWSPDGSRLYLYRIASGAIQIFRLNPWTGKQEAWKRFELPGHRLNPGGLPLISPDGRVLLFANWNLGSTLYLVEGLK